MCARVCEREERDERQKQQKRERWMEESIKARTAKSPRRGVSDVGGEKS